MEKLFLNHIKKNFPSLLDNKFIIAVSGGVDSIVLLHLCMKLKLDFVIAHCNFKLRGDESNNDEGFVNDLAKQNKIKCYLKSFNTIESSNNTNKSIQMTARDLRYEWFESLSKEINVKSVLTAHHLDDSFETFIINLSRGTGIDGLLGIPMINNLVFRPLLIFSKEEIVLYAKENKISWKEDSSNSKKDYLRNQIRLDVMPKLKNTNPDLLKNYLNSVEKLHQSKSIIKDKIDDVFRDISFKKDGKIYFEIKKIKKLSNLEAYIYELFKEYNFTQWKDIKDLLDSQSGKHILSKTHRLLKDRGYLILAENNKAEKTRLLISKNLKETNISIGKLVFSKVNKITNENSNTIFLDTEKLIFPLKVRSIEPGDFFYPFGMGGKKKVSKYLKDEKVSLFNKESVLVLETAKKDIIWLIGMRFDDRFLVTKKTKNITKIQLN